MQCKSTKRVIFGAAILAAAVLATGCTSTVSRGWDESGNASEIIFPDIDKATQPEGIFPNLANLRNIRAGATKDELYYMLQVPHFHEINGAKEWDYIMKFRQPDDSVKVCQYKILFDKNNIARNFYWKPANCLQKPAPAPAPVQKLNLSADALFPFNRGAVGDIKPAGKRQLDALAAQVVNAGNTARLHVVGHTDYLGNDDYNMRLSQQRAYSVKQYLIYQGVAASNITAEGRGETEPVAQCERTRRAGLIECLAPNRRVDIEVRG